MIYIETTRLLLRDWKDSDLQTFIDMNKDEQVMQYFPKTLTDEETNLFYSSILTEFEQEGFGLYAVEVKARQQFIGFIGFHKATFESDFTPCVEIGWRLHKDAWGQGYATEGAKSCLQYGFNTLGLTNIYSFTAEANVPSQNVMRKIGMQFRKTFDHPKLEQSSPLKQHVLYHISQPET